MNAEDRNRELDDLARWADPEFLIQRRGRTRLYAGAVAVLQLAALAFGLYDFLIEAAGQSDLRWLWATSFILMLASTVLTMHAPPPHLRELAGMAFFNVAFAMILSMGAGLGSDTVINATLTVGAYGAFVTGLMGVGFGLIRALWDRDWL